MTRTGRTDAAVATAAAAAGAAVVREAYGASHTRHAKSATDFATEVDIASERAIRAVIRAARPDDAIEGEELGSSGEGPRRWLVDPLCGTLNYAAQTPLAAVNVALQTATGVTVAAVVDPIADEMFWTDGERSWIRTGDTDAPLTPSATSMLVDVNCDGRIDREFVGGQLVADPRMREIYGPRVLSTTLAVAWVAAGRRAAYITDGDLEGSVHFTAGTAICKAAGCVVTDLAGEVLHSGRGMIVAANAETHRRLLDIIAPHLAAVL